MTAKTPRMKNRALETHSSPFQTAIPKIFLIACALALVFSPVSTKAFASTSSEMSDDRKDYGWLYKNGDCLCCIQDYEYTFESGGGTYKKDQSLYFFYEGKLYRDTDFNRSKAEKGTLADPLDTIGYRLYGDGTFEYTNDLAVRLESIVNSAPSPQPQLDGSGYVANESSEPQILSSLPYFLDVTDIKRVVFAESIQTSWGVDTFETAACGSILLHLNGWFKDCSNIESIDGMTNLYTGYVDTMARMFQGCSSLKQLDLSSFYTGGRRTNSQGDNPNGCTDFSNMFDGCKSLEVLSFGDGWTQDGAADNAKATFPVDMRNESGAFFYAGDVIPNGTATYTISARTFIRDTANLLTDPATGATANAAERLCCEYTGSAIEPIVSIVDGDYQLVEGTDFTVAYANNVEDGEAKVTLKGIGEHYCGTTTLSFDIQDTGAYAFLYKDGTLFLKANHHVPAGNAAPTNATLASTMRWFDDATANPGAKVPWATKAGKVKSVIVDASFAGFAPTSAAAWFAGCTALTSVQGLSNINANRLTSVAGMFRGCTSLVELDLEGLSTTSVTNFSNFVRGCSALERLDLANIDASRATNMSGFLTGCSALKSVETGSAWRNASTANAQLKASKTIYKVSPSYARVKSGAALANGSAEYRLSDLALQFTTVEMAKSTYTCTGKALKPKMTVKLGNVVLKNGTDYTVSYKNNKYPGKAKAIIKGTGVFSGGLEVPFKIRARTTKVGDRLVYTNKQGTYYLKVTKTKRSGLEATADVALTKVKVKSYKTQSITIPGQCTIGGVVVSITSVSSKLAGGFKNVKTVILGSKIAYIDSWAFAYAPKVKTLKLKTARLQSAEYSLAGSNIKKVYTKKRLKKSVKNKYKRWFTSSYYIGKKVKYRYSP